MGKSGNNPKDNRKYPRGVVVRGNTVWITFTYRGLLCRESLGVPATEKNIEEAASYRDSVYRDIKWGKFDYANEFPHSPNLKKLGLVGQTREGETIRERLLDFMERHEKDRVSHTTYIGYMKSVTGTLDAEFGDYLVSELKPSHIKAWVKRVSKKNSHKTVSNHLIPLKNMYQEIEEDHDLPNPVKRVDLGKYFTSKQKAIKKESENDIDPFSDEEMNAILESMTGQHYNLVYFAFWSGLRTGEMIALRWDRIDWIHRTALINVSSSLEVESRTKTGETRIIDLLPPAIDALKKQKEFTEGEEFVFFDPGWGKPWQNDQAIRRKAWMPYFEKCGVRYRKPYQTRHTFATRMLIAGEDIRWVARQLGHNNLDMIRRHYGHLLPDSKNRSNYETRKDWSKSVNKQALKVVKLDAGSTPK